MAQLILGIALSHGPMLATPPQAWDHRAQADRDNPEHWYRGRAYDFPSLAAVRGAAFDKLCTLEARQRQYAACQRAVAALAGKLREARPDLVVIVGNDQLEVFQEDTIPAIAVYTGDSVENLPLSREQRAKLPLGIEIAMPGYCPPEAAYYPGARAEAESLVAALADQGFDVTTSARLPDGADRQHGIPHAFGYVYRNLFDDAPPPSIPIFLNVGVPPGQLRARRCIALGGALGHAIGRLPAGLRVALIASGGLTHFVVDEDFDRKTLQAMQNTDFETLAGTGEEWFNGNNCEIKSWLPVAAAMARLGAGMNLVDYVPCYRTEAGTGQGMAFAYWEEKKQ